MTDPVPAQPHSPDGNEIPSTANGEAAHGEISENSVTATLVSIDALLTELEEKQRSSAAQLEQALKARDEQAAKLKSLEAELALLKAGREKTVVALQRVRHLARRAE